MNNNKTLYRLIFSCCALTALATSTVSAQLYPERKHIRAGVRQYENAEFGKSEEHLRRALEKNPLSWEAAFDLGDALYKQEKYDEAAKVFSELSQNPNLNKQQLAKTYYNLGNTQFAQYDPANASEGKKKLQEAEQSYMKSLLANPDDLEAKYNLAYVQKLLEEQENQNNDDQNKDDQDKNNQDQNNDQNKDNQDQNDGQDQQDKNDQNDSGEQDQQDGDQQDEGDGDQTPPRQSNISREDAEAMLNAIQGQEDQTRDKLNEKKAVQVAPSGKNW